MKREALKLDLLRPALDRLRDAKLALAEGSKRSPASDRWSKLQLEFEGAETALLELWETLR